MIAGRKNYLEIQTFFLSQTTQATQTLRLSLSQTLRDSQRASDFRWLESHRRPLNRTGRPLESILSGFIWVDETECYKLKKLITRDSRAILGAAAILGRICGRPRWLWSRRLRPGTPRNLGAVGNLGGLNSEAYPPQMAGVPPQMAGVWNLEPATFLAYRSIPPPECGEFGRGVGSVFHPRRVARFSAMPAMVPGPIFWRWRRADPARSPLEPRQNRAEWPNLTPP